MRPALLALLALAACGTGPGQAAADPTPKEGAVKQDSDATVRIALAGREPGRPPLEVLSFDVDLHNPSTGPRWFLLPTSLGAGEPFDGGIDGVEVWAGDGAVLARFAGTGGFSAVQVPAGGRVGLRGLTVRSWLEPPPSRVALAVCEADDLRIGGEPVSAWLSGPGACEDGAVVQVAGLARRSTRHTPDRSEVAVERTGERCSTVEVDLGRPG